MKVDVGMSGYSYKEWKGGFYPDDMTPEGMLPFYSARFGSVEINNTFYRMPTEKLLLQWAEQVPADFTFVLKASRRISHMNRLKDVAEHVQYFLQTGAVLGARQGPSFFQLPPNFKKDLPLLQDFLALIPRDARPPSSSATKAGSVTTSTRRSAATTSPSAWWTATRDRHRSSPPRAGATCGFAARRMTKASCRPGPTGSGASRGSGPTLS